MEQQKTKQMNPKAEAKILSWNEIKKDIQQTNPNLFNVIDNLELPKNTQFCKISYPYGAAVLDEGRFFIPNDRGRIVSIDDSSIPEKYKKFFSNHNIPCGMVLNKSLSLEIEEKRQFIPLHLFYPGMFFGLWELFDQRQSLFNRKGWNIYSGTRSLFTTTKISNLKKYQPLKRKLNLRSRLPKNIKDHYFLFKELANNPSFDNDWASTIIFFSKDLQEQLIKNSKLLPLQAYFLKYIWQQSMPLRFDAMMKLLWNQAASLLKKYNFKNFALQLSVLKHITQSSLSVVPCFIASDPNETTAPLDLIKEILIDEYKVDFCPTIMVPGFINRNKCNGYYSVNESIPLEETYINKSKKTSIETMRSICEIYEFIKNQIFNNEAHSDNHLVKYLVEKVKLDFFHSIFDQKELLLMSSVLPNQDPSLTQLPKKYGKSILPFNDNGSFFRGLIRINTDI